MPEDWLQDYFNTVRAPNTFETKHVIRYAKIYYNSIFSLKSAESKNRNIQPGPVKQYSYMKKECKLSSIVLYC